MIVPIVSIPKSGTHYVNEVIKQLKPNNFEQVFAYNFHNIDSPADVKEEIRRHAAGCDTLCYLGHWSYSDVAKDTLLNYKPIFIYRHPLDVAVSFVEGAEKKLFYDDVVKYFKRIPNKEQRYTFLLHGLPYYHEDYGSHPWLYGLKHIITDRLGWINSGIPSVRYEDIMGQNDRILSLASYFETDFYSLSDAIDKATMNSNSDTFRKGGSNWRSEMPDAVKDIYIKELGDLIRFMKYEV